MSQKPKSVRSWLPRCKKILGPTGHPPYPVWVGGALWPLQARCGHRGGVLAGPHPTVPGCRASVGGPTVGVYGRGPQLTGHPTVPHPAPPYGGGGGPTGPGWPGPGCVGVAGGPVGELQDGGVVVVVHGVAPCGVG